MPLTKKFLIKVRDLSFPLFLVGLATVGSAFFAFLFQLILARGFDPQTYGVVQGLKSIVLILVPIAAIGSPGYLLYVFGKSGENGNKIVNLIIKWVLIFVSLVALISIPLINYIFPDVALYLVLIWGALTVAIVFNEVGISLSQIEKNYKEVAVRLISINFVSFCTLGILIYSLNLNGVKTASLSVLVASLISLSISIPLILKKIKKGVMSRLSNNDGYAIIKFRLGSMAIYSMAAISHTIYYYSDIAILNHFGEHEEAGYYSAAFALISVAYVLPTIIIQRLLLARFHEWAYHKLNYLRAVVLYSVIGLGLSGGIISSIFFSFSEAFIEYVYTESYSLATGVFQILLIAIPLRFMSSVIGAALMTRGYIKLKVSLMASVALLNFTLNIFFIPKYGMYAAAVTTILSEFILFALYSFFYRFRFLAQESSNVQEKFSI